MIEAFIKSYFTAQSRCAYPICLCPHTTEQKIVGYIIKYQQFSLKQKFSNTYSSLHVTSVKSLNSAENVMYSLCHPYRSSNKHEHTAWTPRKNKTIVLSDTVPTSLSTISKELYQSPYQIIQKKTIPMQNCFSHTVPSGYTLIDRKLTFVKEK